LAWRSRASRPVGLASSAGSSSPRVGPCWRSSAWSISARLPEDLLDLALELVEGAVGLVGGVGRHLGAIQRDQAQADQPGGGAQPQGLD
jgi:hypothetical protein